MIFNSQSISMYNYNKQFNFCLAILSTIIFFWLISNLFFNDIWKGLFQESNPDALLFTRQLEQSLLKGKVLDTDNYAAFPYEVKTGFAPFYMNFLVAFVNLFFAIFPKSSIEPIYIAGVLPILFSWLLTTILIVSIYKLSKNRIITLFCAVSLLPGYSTGMVTGFLNLDYDYIISFFIWIWLINAAFYLKTEKHIFVYLGSVVSALFISTWNGSPFFYFFATIYAFILWLINPKKQPLFLDYASITMFIGGVIALIFVPRTDESLRYFLSGSVERYSYIQSLLVIFGSVFLIFLKKISLYENPRKIGIVLIGVLFVIFIGIFHEILFRASGILLKTDPVHATITELFKGFDFEKIFDSAFKDTLFRFGILFFFIPLSLFVSYDKKYEKELKFISHWIIIFICLTVFYQVRYIRWLGCGYGLLSGFILYFIWNMLKNNIKTTKYKLIKCSIVLFPIILTNAIINYSVITQNAKLSAEEIELFSWIKECTPSTSGYFDNNKPEYGILSYWDLGNKISYYTKRPVAVSNSLWGYKTMADVFSTENEKDAYNQCLKYKIGYLVLEPSRFITNNIFAYWQVFKNMPETGEYKLYYGEVSQRESYDYLYSWLSKNLGLTSLGEFGISNNFRLVFANTNEKNMISRYLVFQPVKGAIFELNNLEASTSVSLSLEFEADKIPFVYKVTKVSEENGVCSFALPYSTDFQNGNIKTDSFYKIAIEKEGKKKLAKLFVSDREVINGSILNLDEKLNYLSTSE